MLLYNEDILNILDQKTGMGQMEWCSAYEMAEDEEHLFISESITASLGMIDGTNND